MTVPVDTVGEGRYSPPPKKKMSCCELLAAIESNSQAHCQSADSLSLITVPDHLPGIAVWM